MTSEELERRKAICLKCPDFRTRDRAVIWCHRKAKRPNDGVYCLPWAANEYRKMLVDEQPNGGCPKWHEGIVPNASLAPVPPITATITMCRRLELMREMIDSLLDCVLDRSHIVRWIAMDDGSVSNDLYQLAERYPFLEIVVNDMKGHPAALNQLFALVETDYIFHLEDDWRFETPGRLLEACWSVMQHDPRTGVVCLRGYHFGDTPTPEGFTHMAPDRHGLAIR